MNQLLDILLSINETTDISQRELCEVTGLSIGTINTLVNYLVDNHFLTREKLRNKSYYSLTEKGDQRLKELLLQQKAKIISLETDVHKKIKYAVILAAGPGVDLDEHPGLVSIDDEGTTPLSRTIQLLEKNDIEQIFIVVGFQKDKVIEQFNRPNIHFVENLEYSSTGTMHSLSKLFDSVQDDFLLIEGDIVYEERCIEKLIQSSASTATIVTGLSGSGDEAFVDFDSNNNLVNLSKDIRQVNRLSFEMIGLSKISAKIFSEIEQQYENNNNQWLNYEYLLLQLSKLYQIKCLVLNDLVWCDIDDNKSYQNAIKKVFPRIKKRQEKQALDYAKHQLATILSIPETEIKDLTFAGGMTNLNYKATINDTDYFIRIPGECTEVMINRYNEALNAQIGSALGINVDTLYINADSGIKITEAVANAETLTGRTTRTKPVIKQIASILKSLHQSEIEFPNDFEYLVEYDKYEQLIEDVGADYYPRYEENRALLMKMFDELVNDIKLDRLPCHNDLVPENFVRNGEGKIYLLDWEYSGMHDPYWDFASLTIESEFTKQEIEEFFKEYLQRTPTKRELRKLDMFKVCQDFLWANWTIAKEASGDDFGSYGLDRYLRGEEKLKELMNHYE